MTSDVLRLSTGSVDWLHDAGATGADADDLGRTYGFLHELNRTRELDESVRFDSQGRRHLRWQLWFFTEAREEVLDQPLVRKILAAAPLCGSDGHGLVAYNATFYVREHFRRRRLASTVYASESDLYRHWGIRQIQMRAQRDGPSVWIRSFGFLPTEPQLLAADYRGWARRGGHPTERVQNPAEYPEEFLHSVRDLELYKVLS